MDTVYSSAGFKGSPGRDEGGWRAERREMWRAEQEGENSTKTSKHKSLHQVPQAVYYIYCMYTACLLTC